MSSPTNFDIIQPKHLYSITLADVSIIDKMDKWAPQPDTDDEGWQIQPDTCTDIQTSTRVQLYYLALMSVVIENGVNHKDRFIKNKKFLPITELKNITRSGKLEKQDPLDSLADLLNLSYKKISVTFKYRLSMLDNNFKIFWFFRHVFQSAVSLLKQYSRNEFSGSIHTKALLTLLLKQKNANTLINEVKRFCG
jgi:hypothetical protein